MKRLLSLRHARPILTMLPANSPVPEDDANDLSADGASQATELAKRLKRSLKELGKIAVVTSPAKRCSTTASAIAAQLGATVSVDPRLGARAFDRSMVRTVAELRAWQNTALRDPFSRVGTGESEFDQRNRVGAWLASALGMETADTVIAVTHGSAIEHLGGAILGSAIQGMEAIFLECDHARFHSWRVEATPSQTLGWVLEGVNLDDLSRVFADAEERRRLRAGQPAVPPPGPVVMHEAYYVR